MATFEDLAREHSRITGKYVVVIRSSNAGTSTRYNAYAPFGQDVVAALADNDAAYLALNSHEELVPMVREAVNNVRDNASVLTLEVVAFEDGAEAYSTSA